MSPDVSAGAVTLVVVLGGDRWRELVLGNASRCRHVRAGHRRRLPAPAGHAARRVAVDGGAEVDVTWSSMPTALYGCTIVQMHAEQFMFGLISNISA